MNLGKGTWVEYQLWENIANEFLMVLQNGFTYIISYKNITSYNYNILQPICS